jgi:hypothetical protein
MSTQIRDVPGTGNGPLRLQQTRFWGGGTKMRCLQVTDQKGNFLQLDKIQARDLAIELILFSQDAEIVAEGAEPAWE